MLIIHAITQKNKIGETTYNVYMGSSGNKFIFNITPANEQAPSGGYPNLGYICSIKNILEKDEKTIIFKAERIMGKSIYENSITK